MRQIPRRAIGIATAGVLATVAMSGVVYASGHRSGQSSSNHWPYASTSRSTARTAVLSAVGDVACEPDDEENQDNPSSLKCGGEQYAVGELTDFERWFDKTVGAFRFLQRPAPGNTSTTPTSSTGTASATSSR